MEEVQSRLRAYLAWCLWNDVAVYRHLLEPDNLAAMFDPQPKRDMINDLADRVVAWEAFTGQKLELLSDQEAALDRARAERHFTERLALLETWLKDPRLSPWAERVEKGRVQSFFHLVGGERQGVRGSLTARAMGFAYAQYKRGSGAIHASTVEGALYITPTFVTPEFFDVVDRAGASVESIVVGTNLFIIPLSLIAKVL